MMDWYRLSLLYLWIAPHLLLAVVAALLWKRRLHIKLPVFTLYVWYEIAEFLALFTITKSGLNQNWYVRIFPVTLAISAVLRFGVIQEIFNNVYGDESNLNALARVSLRWTTACLIVAAVFVSIFATGQTSNTLIVGAAFVGRALAFVQCGLVLFLFLFSRLLGVSLQSYVFGIALGFGMVGSLQLVDSAWRATELSESMARGLNLLTTGGYHIAVLIWLGYLIMPARKSVPLSNDEPFYDFPISHVHHWKRELERFLQ
jgi:hypothetical protein